MKLTWHLVMLMLYSCTLPGTVCLLSVLFTVLGVGRGRLLLAFPLARVQNSPSIKYSHDHTTPNPQWAAKRSHFLLPPQTLGMSFKMCSWNVTEVSLLIPFPSHDLPNLLKLAEND